MLALINRQILGFTFRVKKLGTNIFGVEGGVAGNDTGEEGVDMVDMVDMDILYMVSRF